MYDEIAHLAFRLPPYSPLFVILHFLGLGQFHDHQACFRASPDIVTLLNVHYSHTLLRLQYIYYAGDLEPVYLGGHYAETKGFSVLSHAAT